MVIARLIRCWSPSHSIGAAEIAMRRVTHDLAPGEAMHGCPLCGYTELPFQN